MSALLEVKNLKKYFKVPAGLLHAVDDISFTLEEGKTMGRTIIHLMSPTSGQIFFDGKDISAPTAKELTRLREQMQIIFQDPYSSLNPRMTVSEAITEPLLVQGNMSSTEIRKEVLNLMDTVGLAARFENS